jgi:OOP family OmpA-OmpF porin
MRVKNKMVSGALGVFVFVMLGTNVVFAQEDVEGSKDHPLISRYPGSFICYYDVKEFDEYVLPLGKLDEGGKLTKSQGLEGKVTQITYLAPEGRSMLEIYRNYELALQKAGFETLFSITSKELGEGWGAWAGVFISAIGRANKVIEYLIPFGWGEGRYLADKLIRPEGDVYVAVAVGHGGGPEVMVQLDVIEVKPMETGLVTVNADALAKDIARTGHVAVYGICFDTGKADVKPESEPVLKEIAKVLQQNPKLNLYVVGHTDNIGTLTANMGLSQLRAESVIKSLVSGYGVDGKRLISNGIGPLSPVASNKTEEGRSKNRRVELVER